MRREAREKREEREEGKKKRARCERVNLFLPMAPFFFRFSAPLVIPLDISNHQIIGQCTPRLLHEYWRYGVGSRHLHKIQTKTFSYV